MKTKIQNLAFELRNNICLDEYPKLKHSLKVLENAIEEFRVDSKKYLDEGQKEKFIIKNNHLLKEWEKHRLTQIKDSMDLSLNFFMWLIHIKKIDFEKTMKGGLKK